MHCQEEAHSGTPPTVFLAVHYFIARSVAVEANVSWGVWGFSRGKSLDSPSCGPSEMQSCSVVLPRTPRPALPRGAPPRTDPLTWLSTAVETRVPYGIANIFLRDLIFPGGRPKSKALRRDARPSRTAPHKASASQAKRLRADGGFACARRCG